MTILCWLLNNMTTNKSLANIQGSLIERLAPEVVEYATPHFALKDDLDNLDKVQRVGAPEATSLYCARILEALAAAALETIELPASSNVFSNLNALQRYNLLPTVTRYWAHALRRIGNDVRHIRRRILPEDAELAVVFVERFLEWFFRHFRYGHRLPSLTRDRGQFGFSNSEELRTMIETFDEKEFAPRAVLEQSSKVLTPVFLKSPALPAVLSEMLLDRKEHTDAYTVLNEALNHFPVDLRLRQLMGLYWSRTGNLTKALEGLEPLYAQFKDDDEAAGIMAGVYKRVWLVDNSPKWLEKAHRAYLKGWERSRESNAYLGINAATTALWLGKPMKSRQIAEEVRHLLRSRAEALAKYESDPDLALNYWDHVTLAEAELLLGDFATARRTYHEAFAQHPEQRANIQVSRDQAKKIFEALGMEG